MLSGCGTERTSGWKESSSRQSLERDGYLYWVNSRGSGLYLPILHAGIDQFHVCLKRWRRVFALRVDLRQPYYNPDSKRVSRFRKNLARRLERSHGVRDVGFLWVREQERSKAQHYHLVFMMDGDLVRSPNALWPMIRETWERVAPGGSVHFPKDGHYFVHRDDAKARREFVWRVSYLAKCRGKGYRPPASNDYSASRLT
ncbi:inovirus-type Gp2 protein [Granulosicoccaceae sp. 1_MG-2023]|nr:inovirus-type Gp2 protein [Granulosicoccaceae sp. 1_MG-2023]